MLVAEIKDHCAEARALLTIGKADAGLSVLNQVIATTDDPIMQNHPMMGVVFALKAELLQSLGLRKVEQAEYLAQALKVSNQHLHVDFENVAPILLNIVRYYVKEKQQDQARSAADLMLAGCVHYYGKDHPRLFQLQRWIEEAGCY
jgi:hypothetical protein